MLCSKLLLYIMSGVGGREGGGGSLRAGTERWEPSAIKERRRDPRGRGGGESPI